MHLNWRQLHLTRLVTSSLAHILPNQAVVSNGQATTDLLESEIAYFAKRPGCPNWSRPIFSEANHTPAEAFGGLLSDPG